MTGKVQVALDVLAQRFRAIETAARNDGGWALARHLEIIPDARAGTVTQGLRAVMADAERRSQRLTVRTLPNRAYEANWKDRGWKPEGGARESWKQSPVDQLPSALEGAAPPPEKAKGKGAGKGKKKGKKY